MVRLVYLFGFLLFTQFSFSQKIWSGYEHLLHPVRNYIIYQTISEINIDGKPNEISWQQAEWSEYFQDIEGDAKPEPLYNTRFKMLWDSENLYILAELEEPHIWAYYKTHDQIVYRENDFEIFIDPDRDTHNYFEFELNAQNTLFDLFMPKPYRNGGRAEINWNIKDFKSAVSLNGTLNYPVDIDEKWTVEVAVPFKYLTKNGKYTIPKDGSYWKINFSRVQWQTEVIDGKYQKIKDVKTGKYKSENNWVWSAPGVINMHFPERWGLVQFSSNKTGSNTTKFYLPNEERFAKFLWNIYYKQKNYRLEKGKYADSLSALEISSSTKTVSGETIWYEMKAENDGFTVIMRTEDGLKLSINQNGLFQILNK